MEYYVNEHIRCTERVFPRQNRYDYYRYDLNENPEGLPAEFVDKVLNEITPEFLSTYPEPEKFLRKYAKFIGMSYDNVTVTNGSDMAIRYLFETFGEKGKSVVTVTPTFEMYRINCSILGLKHIPVEYEADLSVNVEKIVGSINRDTCIVVMLNPNNPIGNVYNDDEMEKVVAKASEVGAIVIVDEAYHYFYDKTFLNLINKYNNVVVLRTFSKLFSIAACRIGTIISTPDIIHYINNGKLSFEVNSIALLFAERIIEDSGLVTQLIEEERKGKEFIISELIKKGYSCRDCKGNFIFVKPFSNADEIVARLENEERILVHAPYRHVYLKDYVRVSVGSIKAMKRFVEAFFRVDSK